MKRLGISVYPSHSSMDEIIEYVELAAKYGFKRIFTCLLSVEGKTTEEVVAEFKRMLDVANKHGMEVIADLDPTVFKNLGASITDLSVFKEMGLSGIRFDEGFAGNEESIMSFNPYDLKVELNMSNGTKYVDNILSFRPNVNNIYGCHNFYPHVYTGLSLEHYMKCTEQFKELGINTAAFVNSPTAKFGPWPVSEGLCTLEMHRDLPIDLQVRHLFATRMIDDVMIGNAYASEEELEACSKINPGILTFGIELDKELTEVEYEILYYKENHANRGDVSEYMARSSAPRGTFANESIQKANAVDMKRGDVVILNDEYSRYKGELHIVLKDMPNDGRKNVIGHIPKEELFLLNYMEPRKIFTFKKNL